tara:strand:- start:2528 stop:2836 length:309 start_codon:yes stop_codon:yes gene_type:complete
MTKYRAIKTEVDGITFDSRKEAARYKELILLEKSGVISHLELQPQYDCVVDGKKICSYRADFRYFDEKSCVIEDVKGYKTPVYKLKKKLVEALYPGMKIVEV